MKEDRNGNKSHKYKECYVVETDSADEKELKDLIKEILRRQLNQIDL